MRTLAMLAAALPMAAEYAKVDDARVYYSLSGTASTAVVLVNGWTCNSTFWSDQEPELARSFRVLNVDLLGHGKSDAPKREYTMDLMSRGVLAAMDAAKIDKAVLVGHSMGTTVNRAVYNHSPKRVAAFVSVDAALFRNWKPEFEENFRKSYAGIDGPDGLAFRTKWIEHMFADSTSPELRKRITTAMVAPAPYVAKSALDHLVTSHLWNSGVVDVPALAINKRSKRDSTEKIHRAVFTNLEYREMDGVSHFLMMEKPAEFNSILIEFLRKIDTK